MKEGRKTDITRSSLCGIEQTEKQAHRHRGQIGRSQRQGVEGGGGEIAERVKGRCSAIK